MDAGVLGRAGARALGLVAGLLQGGEAQDPDLGPLVHAAVAPAGEDPKPSAEATVPDVGGALVTTTRVTGAKGQVELHLRWLDGAVVALHRNPLILEVPFLPDAHRGDVLDGYQPFLQASSELLMVANKSGPIALHLAGRAFRRVGP
jgi:hypothetical protein